MLNHLSWTSYFEAAIALLLIYYAFVGARYYANDIRLIFDRFSGRQASPGELPAAAPQYQAEENGPAQNVKHPTSIEAYAEQKKEGISEYDFLSGWLKACICKASDKPFAPAELIPQIKKILQAHPELAGSAERPAINELIVQECEKTGTALLTEDEVDQWWGN